jgi:hypothetical protein
MSLEAEELNWELSESLESAVEDDDKKGIRLWKDFMCAAMTVRLL